LSFYKTTTEIKFSHYFVLQKAFDFFVEFNSGLSGFDAAGWKTTFATLYKKLAAKMA